MFRRPQQPGKETKMTKMCEVEVCVVVDADGNYAAGVDLESATQSYNDTIGALEAAEGFRVVYVKLSVPLPEAIVLVGEVPADQAQAKMLITQA
jgi:hypothetical protein